MFCAASCFCRPGEARELVTLGARGGEGMDTPPGCPVLPVGRFTWTQSVSPTPTLPGVTRLVLPAAPHDLSLFIQHFHVLRSSSELSPPLKGS